MFHGSMFLAKKKDIMIGWFFLFCWYSWIEVVSLWSVLHQKAQVVMPEFLNLFMNSSSVTRWYAKNEWWWCGWCTTDLMMNFKKNSKIPTKPLVLFDEVHPIVKLLRFSSITYLYLRLFLSETFQLLRNSTIFKKWKFWRKKTHNCRPVLK